MKMKSFIIPSVICIGFLGLIPLRGIFALGQENLADTCALDKIETQCKTITPQDCRKVLETCQTYYEQESARINNDISKTQKQKDTLKNKINTLSQKIKDLNYQISRSNLVIKDLKIQITDTQGSIDKTTQKISDSEEKLREILRTIHEQDQKGQVEILLFGASISDFFNNLASLEVLNSKNKDLLDNIKILKTNLQTQMTSLDSEKGDLEKTVALQTLQVSESKKTKQEQESNLTLTEQEYQKKLTEKQSIEKKASEIRARIFELFGVAKAPTFGEAYEIAKFVAGATGIRPAFLLAILTQESNLGKNVGQCYLKNQTTGDGVVVSSGAAISRVMKPSRDVEPFLDITRDLGRDSFNTPISCPMSFGYGGAMGPAQFIPSTWALFKDRLKDIIQKPADPWLVRDSFLAAGLYLTDAGARTKTYNDEWKSALRYFSGSANTKYRFYADSVMRIASQYEDDIKALEAAKK